MSPDQPSTSQVPDSILGRNVPSNESVVLLKNRMTHPFLTKHFPNTSTSLRKPGKRKSPLEYERLTWTSKQHITEERIASSMRELSLEPVQIRNPGEVQMDEADNSIPSQRPSDEGFCEDYHFEMTNGEILDRLPRGTGPIFNIAPDMEESITKLMSKSILPEPILEALMPKPCSALVLFRPSSALVKESSPKFENVDVTHCSTSKEKDNADKRRPKESVRYEDMCVESWSDDDENDVLML